MQPPGPIELAPVTCFVIGPIGDRLAVQGSEERLRYEASIQTLETVIEPACITFGLEPVRADGIAQPGEITDQIFRHLRDDDIVIVDVTGGNPNVMYELGLRHTTGKLTIQIGETGRLPFDIGIIRTIRFIRTELGLIQARDELVEAIRAGLEGRFDPVTATRVWNESLAEQGTGTSREVAAAALAPPGQEITATEEDEPGFLDLLAEAEASFPLAGEKIQETGEIIEEMSALMTEATAEVERSDARGGSSGARLLIANRLADSLTSLAERLEEVAQSYADRMNQVNPGISYIISELERDPAQLAEAPEFPDQVNTLAAATREGLESAAGLATVVEGIGSITRRLREPSRRISRALRDFAQASEVIYEWEDKVRTLPPPPEGEPPTEDQSSIDRP